jgi:hypothetical protein
MWLLNSSAQLFSVNSSKYHGVNSTTLAAVPRPFDRNLLKFTRVHWFRPVIDSNFIVNAGSAISYDD